VDTDENSTSLAFGPEGVLEQVVPAAVIVEAPLVANQ